MAAKIHGNITEIFYFSTMFFYPKLLVLCPEVDLLLEYMVWVAIYNIIPCYYRIYDNKCPFSL